MNKGTQKNTLRDLQCRIRFFNKGNIRLHCDLYIYHRALCITRIFIGHPAKEIGIRKILAANAASLGLLLGIDFVRLIIFSIIIATPLGWWAADKWLQSFAYRMQVSWITLFSQH
jgi:hypothetical protein